MIHFYVYKHSVQKPFILLFDHVYLIHRHLFLRQLQRLLMEIVKLLWLTELFIYRGMMLLSFNFLRIVLEGYMTGVRRSPSQQNC